MKYATRRTRFLILVGALAILSIIYVSTGAASTTNSDFYRKTVSLMEIRSQNIERMKQQRSLTSILIPCHTSATSQSASAQTTSIETEETLRQRLQKAERAAKKSADEKYRALQDVERVILENREAMANEKSIAGRKMMPVPQGPEMAPPMALAPAATDLIRTYKAHDQAPLAPDQSAAEEELASILKRSPVIIFSKSYCPHSRKAKRILEQAYTIVPSPYVVELDQHPKGQRLQDALERATGRRTVPNIIVNGRSMGGGDEMERLWKSGELPVTLKQLAGKKVEKVVENFSYTGSTGAGR